MKIKAWARGWSFSALLLLAVTPALSGQLPPAQDTLRGKRVLGVANVAFFDAWKPNVTVGVLGQISLSPMVPTLEDGVLTYAAPRWYAHGMLTGGVVTEGGEDLALYGEVGLVRRLDLPGFFTSFGVAGFYDLAPEGFGGVFRTDLLMDNAFLQLGVIRFRETEDLGFYAGFGFMRCLLKDLEFSDRCIGG